MSKTTCQVVKLGGSLLEFAQLESNWWHWLRESGCAQTIVVVGGGATVDELRAEQQTRNMTDAEAHWAAITVMGTNARQVAARLLAAAGDGLVVTRLEQLVRALRNLPLIFVDPLELLREDEPWADGTRLPRSWDVTSDSIAARIAELSGCQALTLLKSALPGAVRTYSEAAATGYVDDFFPTAAAHLANVVCANLQAAPREQQVLFRD